MNKIKIQLTFVDEIGNKENTINLEVKNGTSLVEIKDIIRKSEGFPSTFRND
jgi:hypothetical protein